MTALTHRGGNLIDFINLEAPCSSAKPLLIVVVRRIFF
jgi:hypothetical protein